jgi:hypothetical protein
MAYWVEIESVERIPDGIRILADDKATRKAIRQVARELEIEVLP